MKKSFSISILAITMLLGGAAELSAAELSQGFKTSEIESAQKNSAKDKRGMRSAFLGTNDDSGSQDGSSEDGVGLEGGEYGASTAGGSSPGTSVSFSTITRIANNNTTISTPYTYKGK